MKIWSDTLTGQNLHDACPNLVIVEFELIEGPRVRSRRFEHVRLEYIGGGTRRLQNPGTGGVHYSGKSASWDEHGEWMARLFEIDPTARILGYEDYTGRETFHRITEGRYLSVDKAA